MNNIIYKIADEASEFDQIKDFRLNDKYEYFICKKFNSNKVVAVLAYNSSPPFSLEFTVPKIYSYLDSNSVAAEVNFSCIDLNFKCSSVFFGLAHRVKSYAKLNGVNKLICSASSSCVKEYKKLGFKDLRDTRNYTKNKLDENQALFFDIVTD